MSKLDSIQGSSESKRMRRDSDVASISLGFINDFTVSLIYDDKLRFLESTINVIIYITSLLTLVQSLLKSKLKRKVGKNII